MSVFKLCHNRKDTIKKQDTDPNSVWEKKICPQCGDTVWIYKGQDLDKIAEQGLHIGLLTSVNEEEVWV
jgi:protein-arginine kinase activator protein McsA